MPLGPVFVWLFNNYQSSFYCFRPTPPVRRNRSKVNNDPTTPTGSPKTPSGRPSRPAPQPPSRPKRSRPPSPPPYGSKPSLSEQDDKEETVL